MSTNNPFLAIHIDSQEVNLAAGYLLNEKIHILGLNRYILADTAIKRSSIQNEESFKNTFCTVISDFISNYTKAQDSYLIKELNLKARDDNFIVINNIAYNHLYRTDAGSGLVEEHIVKNILNNHFSPKEGKNNNLSYYSCTADIAATSFLVFNKKKENFRDSKYQININIGCFSTGINFIRKNASNTANNNFPSSFCQQGFNDIATKINTLIYKSLQNEEAKKQFTSIKVNDLLTFLTREPKYLVPTKPADIKISFLGRVLLPRNALDSTIVLTLQQIFHNCYTQFCKLDSEGYRFDEGFLENVTINVMGYGASIPEIAKCAALIFSIRLQKDKEIRQRTLERKALAKNNQNRELIKAEEEYSVIDFNFQNNDARDKYTKKVQYLENKDDIKFPYQNLPVTSDYVVFDEFCGPMSPEEDNYVLKRNIFVPRDRDGNFQLDSFSSVLGFIYNFYPKSQNEINEGFVQKLMRFFKIK